MECYEQKFLLSVGSRTDNLALLREFASHVGTQAGLSPDDVGRLELAVDEACANVIEHAYQYDTTQTVVVRAVYDSEQIRIEVIDTGKGFDPSSMAQDSVEKLVRERKKGGLGLRLIRSLVDEVQYVIEPGKRNELIMVKRLSPK